MNYSKNYRALYLYSGMLGAFLENDQINFDLPENRWFHPSLPLACEWLQQHNPYLRAYYSIGSTLCANTEPNIV